MPTANRDSRISEIAQQGNPSQARKDSFGLSSSSVRHLQADPSFPHLWSTKSTILVQVVLYWYSQPFYYRLKAGPDCPAVVDPRSPSTSDPRPSDRAVFVFNFPNCALLPQARAISVCLLLVKLSCHLSSQPNPRERDSVHDIHDIHTHIILIHTSTQ